MLAEEIDHVVVTGDVTHRGRRDEYEQFLEVFEPLSRRGKLTVIPGNHDRTGDDVAGLMMNEQRVSVEVATGLYMVLVDSTGPHNRHVFRGHGMVTASDLSALGDALDDAPEDHVVVVLMHHHPYPLPEEGPLEVLSSWVGLPYAAELDCGADVLDAVRGRCDLLLHGHRHRPRARVSRCIPARPLRLYNAGSSTELDKARVFRHDAGVLEASPHWLGALGRRVGGVVVDAPASLAVAG